MADTKISALGNMTALAGTELLTGLQGGVNLNTTPAQIATYVQGSIASSAMTQLSQTIISGSSTAQLTFTGYPSTYRDLQLRISGRTTESGVASKLQLNFNSDTGLNYTYQYLVAQGGVVSGASASSPASAWCGCIGGTTSAGGCIVDIMNYRDTTFNKMVKATGFSNGNIFDTSSIWLSNSAITNIVLSIVTGGNQFASGTVVTLYGIGS